MSDDARVGIVLVSHSAGLAEGAAELARQVSGGQVRVEPAGAPTMAGSGRASPRCGRR
jgi:phosphoenolpyruvate---glycerone phosphotransferase subunit DhaM